MQHQVLLAAVQLFDESADTRLIRLHLAVGHVGALKREFVLNLLRTDPDLGDLGPALDPLRKVIGFATLDCGQSRLILWLLLPVEDGLEVLIRVADFLALPVLILNEYFPALRVFAFIGDRSSVHHRATAAVFYALRGLIKMASAMEYLKIRCSTSIDTVHVPVYSRHHRSIMMLPVNLNRRTLLLLPLLMFINTRKLASKIKCTIVEIIVIMSLIFFINSVEEVLLIHLGQFFIFCQQLIELLQRCEVLRPNFSSQAVGVRW